MKLPQGRLKTGTPPRLDGRTIDYSRLLEQPGDGAGPGEDPLTDVPVFSFLGDPAQHPRQVSCWITQTNARTHEIIRSGFDREPDVHRHDRRRRPALLPEHRGQGQPLRRQGSHQIFLEPEGLTTHEVYPNGISTSLPFDVQLDAVQSIAGLENAHIVRPGYAIEYDYFDPARAEAELRDAGDRAACSSPARSTAPPATRRRRRRGCTPASTPRSPCAATRRGCRARDQAYLGVLVDDLVTKGVTEPYRMFTSRAEYRLHLREDNADLRLTEIGRRLGLVGRPRWAAFERKQELVSRETARLQATRRRPGAGRGRPARAEPRLRMFDLLRRPGVGFDELASLAADPDGVSRETLRAELGRAVGRPGDRAASRLRAYAGYIDKQQEQVERSRHADDVDLPASLDYAAVRALSFEARQVLARHRPETIGQAARLPGVTPAAISLLLVHLKKLRRGERPRPTTAAPCARTLTAAPSPRAERPTFGDTLGAAAEALGLQLSSAQTGSFSTYVALLDRWNRTYNLTAVRDPADMLTQHVIDCLAAVPAASPDLAAGRSASSMSAAAAACRAWSGRSSSRNST